MRPTPRGPPFVLTHHNWKNGRPLEVADKQLHYTFTMPNGTQLRERILSFLEHVAIMSDVLPCNDLPELVASYAEAP